MNWFGFAIFVGICIFAVWQVVALIKDIRNRRKNKSATAEKSAGDLKGEQK